jgi:hypothetical protein
MRRAATLVVALSALVAGVVVKSQGLQPTDRDSILRRIEEETLRRSAVLDHASHLTEVQSTRLTGTPAFAAALTLGPGRFCEPAPAIPILPADPGRIALSRHFKSGGQDPTVRDNRVCLAR